MAATPFFTMRLADHDRRRVDALGERWGLSASDVLRRLVRSAEVTTNAGIPPLTLRDEAKADSARELNAVS